MTTAKRVWLFISLITFACCRPAVVAPPAPLLPLPTAAQQAWHAMEMNAFIHFTTNTFTDKEWGYGDEQPSVFNPSMLDTDQWISTLRDAGFKGVILTCKHHDGFCLWPSKYTTHTVAKSPYQRDVVGQVSASCKKYGLKFGIYLSPWDRNRADYGSPAYIEYYRNQLKELFTSYGPVFEMWFDGANGGDGFYGGAREQRKIDGRQYYGWPATLAIVQAIEPDVIFFSDAGPGVRWVGNERGLAGETNWNTITPDTLFAGKAGIETLLNTGHAQGTHWIPAETDVSIRPGWFYHAAEDSLVKTPEQLLEIYLTSVGRGSTLLLNVPPDKTGLLHANDVKALKGFRALLDSTFRTDLAAQAIITADSYRGTSDTYSAKNLTDANDTTYWATNDNVTTASIEVAFAKEQLVKYLVLQEYIRLGQRVKSFTISVWKDNGWKPVASATTIGYKRIIELDNIETLKIKIAITESKACPILSAIHVY